MSHIDHKGSVISPYVIGSQWVSWAKKPKTTSIAYCFWNVQSGESVGLQCLFRCEAAADHLWWDCKLLTYICWHFQIPGPGCQPSQPVPTRRRFSPDLLSVTYKVRFIRSGGFLSPPKGEQFISVHNSKLLLLPDFTTSLWCRTRGIFSYCNSWQGILAVS